MALITAPIFYMLAIPAVTLLGLSKGGFAGVGQLATPLLSLLLPPLEAAAILLPIMMTQDAISVWHYRRDRSDWNLKVLLIGAAIGVTAAALLATYLSDAMIRIAVGIISIVFVAHSYLSSRKGIPEPKTATAKSGVFWGAISGFTSFLAQAGNPPFMMHMLPQRLPKMIFVGTNAIFFAAVNASKVLPFMLLGNFSTSGLATSAVLLPLAVATNALGIWLVRRTPQEVFYKIAWVMVLIVSVELIRAGSLEIWRGH